MAYAKPHTTRPSASAKDMANKDPGTQVIIQPLIPEHNQYLYLPKSIMESTRDIVGACNKRKLKIVLPVTPHTTSKLVHVLCSAAGANVWPDECEEALRACLPLREHHKALLSHTMFVTMIGTLVARALEQDTRNSGNTLDLLADRHYVRSIMCHDSSKTSKMEATAYAGIMAVHMEMNALADKAKERQAPNQRCGSKLSQEDTRAHSWDNIYRDPDALITPMANFGLKHHYKENPHHPEHFTQGGAMCDMNLVEAIVDGLACIFEGSKGHKDVHSWLDMYKVERFRDARNKNSAREILEALKTHVTEDDYKALSIFRWSIDAIVGESPLWSRVNMDACCTHTVNKGDQRDLLSCYRPRGHDH